MHRVVPTSYSGERSQTVMYMGPYLKHTLILIYFHCILLYVSEIKSKPCQINACYNILHYYPLWNTRSYYDTPRIDGIWESVLVPLDHATSLICPHPTTIYRLTSRVTGPLCEGNLTPLHGEGRGPEVHSPAHSRPSSLYSADPLLIWDRSMTADGCSLLLCVYSALFLTIHTPATPHIPPPPTLYPRGRRDAIIPVCRNHTTSK